MDGHEIVKVPKLIPIKPPKIPKVKIKPPHSANYLKAITTAKHKAERLGETRVMNCGLSATVVGYRKSEDIDVLFENGMQFNHVTYGQFSTGRYALKN